MLYKIAPCISPELIAVLHTMGHGDEIVFADAFFPGNSFNSRTLRADGVRMVEMLKGVLSLINLDTFVADPVAMMAAVDGDQADPKIAASYRKVIDRHWPGTPPTAFIERFAFYERTRKAYAVVVTGETSKYGNIILKKGVIPV